MFALNQAIPLLPGWADHLPATKTGVNIKRASKIASVFFAAAPILGQTSFRIDAL
jgi:hypothetical protein